MSETGPQEARPRHQRLSPLTRRILAVNMMPILVLVVGLLYLDEYRATLVEQTLASLHTQGQMFAAALAEGAVYEESSEDDPEGATPIDLSIARNMVRRLAEPAELRARLFSLEGALLADSRTLYGPSGEIEVEELAPPHREKGLSSLTDKLRAWLMRPVANEAALPRYRESHPQKAKDYVEVLSALDGDMSEMIRSNAEGGVFLSIAVPVQRFKQVVGALMLMQDSREIEQRLLQVRLNILEMTALALGVTVLLSLYLAGTIARPVRRLALAAERVRRGHGRRPDIPRFPGRHDEISELAHALADMTEALWARMDAIESFAADVAHEIKNPLTSLRSAVETISLVADPDQKARLMAIIVDDVGRLDRLITDISDASRLDAELSRAEAQPVPLASLLQTLADIHGATKKPGAPSLELALPDDDSLSVPGIESRLAQVMRNLIANAVSFSPMGGTIRVRALRSDGLVRIDVEDEGPGIPDGKTEAIFDRFYSERPAGEKFGTHSGLGLAISRQIVTAHQGSIQAENRVGPDGSVLGARFTVLLPAKDD
ncbi:MAG: stimulus-sensing domain-containing protein [Alphaproteobacteria bacterium]|nr:stimulus-sensing domain-containing protein [Alphaproteobacteria bacterium]